MAAKFGVSTEALRRRVRRAQYTSIRYTERPDEAGIAPSIGSAGDSRERRER
jgi:hypothetical protein